MNYTVIRNRIFFVAASAVAAMTVTSGCAAAGATSDPFGGTWLGFSFGAVWRPPTTANAVIFPFNYNLPFFPQQSLSASAGAGFDGSLGVRGSWRRPLGERFLLGLDIVGHYTPGEGAGSIQTARSEGRFFGAGLRVDYTSVDLTNVRMRWNWGGAARLAAGYAIADDWLLTAGVGLSMGYVDLWGSHAGVGSTTSKETLFVPPFSIVTTNPFSGSTSGHHARLLVGSSVGVGVERRLNEGTNVRFEYEWDRLSKTVLTNSRIEPVYALIRETYAIRPQSHALRLAIMWRY